MSKKVETQGGFKGGDWVIATRSLQVKEHDYSLMGGSYTRKDSRFMDKPIKIVGATPDHLVYEDKGILSSDEIKKRLLPMEEVNERCFIIADKILVDAVCGEEST